VDSSGGGGGGGGGGREGGEMGVEEGEREERLVEDG